MEDTKKTELFENTPIPRAVMTLAVPTVLSSLVMVLYNLADTYFVGMLNDPIQNAAVTLAAPVLLAFNAVNNLFGVGSSSMMSRAMGRRDYETVYRSSAFGFYCAVFSGILFSLLCAVFQQPLLNLLGVSSETSGATAAYLKWTVLWGATPAILNVVMAYLVRARDRPPCQCRNHERLSAEYCAGSCFRATLGIEVWGRRAPDWLPSCPTAWHVSISLCCCL